MFARWIIAAAAVAAPALSAHAVHVSVDALGGPISMHANDMQVQFDDTPFALGESSLASIHDSIGAAGIETDNTITFLLADTSVGLSFMALLDDNFAQSNGAGGNDSMLGLASVGPSHLQGFSNSDGSDVIQHFNLGNGTQIYQNLYRWNSANEGDAFGWMGLELGDFVSFSFQNLGMPMLGDGPAFQFLTYSDANGWDIAASADFSPNNQYVFTFQVVGTPAPAPGVAALLAVAGVIGSRRRRRN